MNQSLEAWPGYSWKKCGKRQRLTTRDPHSSASVQLVEETLKEIAVTFKNEAKNERVIPKTGLFNLPEN